MKIIGNVIEHLFSNAQLFHASTNFLDTFWFCKKIDYNF